jgi:HK97 family phage major capsid protein
MERLSDLTTAIKNAPPGRLAGRFFKALLQGRGKFSAAAEVAERSNWIERQTITSIFKSAVSATGTESSTFYPVAQDLQALQAKVSAMRQLQGFRRIPSNVNCLSETVGAVAYWGSEGQAAPVSALAFQRSALVGQRINALSVVTNELAMLATPEADTFIASDHARVSAEKLDATFFDPTNAGSPEVWPKSVTSDAPTFVSSGSSVSAIDSDLRLLIQSLVDGGSNLVNAVWVMNPITASFLGTLRGSGGSPSYPEMGIGGRLLGLPAIATAGITRSGSPSPGTSYLCLVDASRVWLTESGMTFRASDQATVQMDNAPTGNSMTPTNSTLVSMWQTESLALLSSNFVNWKAVTDASAAASLIGVQY